MLRIKLVEPHELEEAQRVLNHKDIIGWLGGFTMLDSLKGKMKQENSMWVAYLDDKMVGVTMFGGRPQSHLVKYGEIAVLPEHQRKHIASAMYFTMTSQGLLEGRRLFEDTIVGDNPTQFKVLPTLGLKLSGELEHRTASAKSLCLFQLSMLWGDVYEKMYERVPKDTSIEIAGGFYAYDLYEKNKLIYAKHSPEYLPKAERYREELLAGKYGVTVKEVERLNRKK